MTRNHNNPAQDTNSGNLNRLSVEETTANDGSFDIGGHDPIAVATMREQRQCKSANSLSLDETHAFECGSSGGPEMAEEHIALDQEACDRRSFLVANFNTAVDMLGEDTGIQLSGSLASKILDTYFEERWYRWPTASKGNLAWHFMRTAVAYTSVTPKPEGFVVR